VGHLSHHGLDMWLACEAARDEKEVWQHAASLHHQGGASSTSDLYKNAAWLMGGNMASDHQQPHAWIYETCSDVLPLRING